MSLIRLIFKPVYIIMAFFIAMFLYFIVYNRYHIIYFEQIQFFRFNGQYFAEFLAKPGGFSEYTGTFLTQFFINPFIGAVILTLTGFAVFALSGRIFRNFNIYGVLWSLIPVLFLVVLHKNQLYKLGYTIGFLFALAYIILYTSITKYKCRYATGIIGWIILYLATGAFSLFAVIICILYELIKSRDPHRYIIITQYVLLAAIFPYLAWRYIYVMPLPDAWHRPLLITNDKITEIFLFLMLGYYPLFLVIMSVVLKLLKKEEIRFSWNWKNILAGIIILFAFSGLIKKYSLDPKMEQLFGIDHYIQKAEWDKALTLCSAYPETNRLIIYFSNLALLKSGQIADKMFHYNQIGSEGLWLPFTLNDFIPFFGCEIYYHLGYINEAYHWAFEALVANGNCPRLLKRLIMTSLINGDLKVAEKYLNLLHQTLFYRGWANHYLKMVNEPGLLLKDKEIREKRNFMIHDDFFAGADNTGLALEKLLMNNPYNKMAYEYYMAFSLLNKDLVSFAENINRLNEFGYKEIPVHYEEAILLFMGFSRQNIIPEGFLIRESTMDQFKNYMDFYASSASTSERVKIMKENFSGTYWHYYHFIRFQETSK